MFKPSAGFSRVFRSEFCKRLVMLVLENVEKHGKSSGNTSHKLICCEFMYIFRALFV